MNISITKQFQRTVDFTKMTNEEETIDSPLMVAMCNLPTGLDVDKWVGMGEDTAILTGETEDEVDEKVMNLITAVELMSKCAKFYPDGEIKGYDFSRHQDYANGQQRDIVNWGGKSKFTSVSACVLRALPNYYIVSEDECDDIGEHLIYFFYTEDFFDGEEGDKLAMLKEEYPVNDKATEFGISDVCYGEIVQLPLSIAQKYMEIEQ
jgi:hypothetical protein